MVPAAPPRSRASAPSLGQRQRDDADQLAPEHTESAAKAAAQASAAYSVRIACIGSTDAARSAGSRPAANATSPSVAAAAASVTGSNADTP